MENIRAELDPESLRKIVAMAKEVRPALKRSVYKDLREAADPVAQAARDEVMNVLPPRMAGAKVGWHPATRSRHTGLREAIAAGVSVGLGSGAMTNGIRITSSGSKLRAGAQRMNRTYNQATFKHPVFGHGSVTQAGHDQWFQKPIEKARPQFQDAILKAMNEAAERLANS